MQASKRPLSISIIHDFCYAQSDVDHLWSGSCWQPSWRCAPPSWSRRSRAGQQELGMELETVSDEDIRAA
jgi:hypothetical protein